MVNYEAAVIDFDKWLTGEAVQVEAMRQTAVLIHQKLPSKSQKYPRACAYLWISGYNPCLDMYVHGCMPARMHACMLIS